MRYQLRELLKPELIFLNINASNAEEVIRKMAEKLINLGFVAPDFFEDVWKREQKYPTGLPTQPFSVALPHADSERIIKTAVCFATLTSPVKFGQMGTDGSLQLDVYIVVLMAIREREKQVELISQLVQIVQDPDLLKQLYKTQTTDEFIRLIEGKLS